MTHPTLSLIIRQEPESSFGPPRIPTLGAPASNFDAYRTAAILAVREAPASWCLTDTDAAGALGRIIDGPIASYMDIERAESALRALLLHEYVEVLIPCAKAQQDSGFVHYIRLDVGERNGAAFAAFEVTPSRDCLFATEYVRIANGQITESTNKQSLLIGTAVESAPKSYRAFLNNASQLASAFPIDIGAFTHYSAPEFQAPLKSGHAGFIDELYRRVYRPWVDIAQGTPLYIDIKLPPLLAVVLSRAGSRADIPAVLKELREELAAARTDLNAMNDTRSSSLSQADIYAHARRVNEAFDAIVPEALLTGAERRWRRILSVFKFGRSALKIYTVASNPLTISDQQLQDMYRTMQSAVATDSRIVSRSVAAATFAELLRVESMQDMLLTHFSDAELKLLAAGKR